MRLRDDVPALRVKRFLKDFRRTLRAACNQPGFRVVHYSVQTNHLHLIVEAADKRAMGVGMKSVCTRIARSVNRVFGRKGPVLLGRYHARQLTSPREVRNGLRYVLLNLRKHRAERGVRSQPTTLDEASSGRWFDGWKRIAWRPPDLDEPREVAEPRYWVTRVGWRRHRLIDPAEVPGAS